MPLVEGLGAIASFINQFKAEFLSKWPMNFKVHLFSYLTSII